MYIPTLAVIDNPGLILLFLLLFFGLIALVTYLLRRFIPGLKDKGGHVNEDIAVQQELERILEPITNEKVLEEMKKTDITKKDE